VKVIETPLSGVLIIEPKVHGDARGFFQETYRQNVYADLGIAPEGFVQDNLSFSQGGVLRGLHFQNPDPQGKLVYVLQGEVFDVAVDIRRGSSTFGQWIGERLSAENARQLFIAPGFAHGFLVLSDSALFTYKCTAYYNAEADAGIAWNDPRIGIVWPVEDPALSEKDEHAPMLDEIDPARLPQYAGTR
jgi:dTDP-4-dehydrorhamnose 3,5-epimerase